MVEDVGDILGRAIRIDGRSDGADLRQSEVEEGPFQRRARERRKGFALLNTPGEEPVREVVDALGGLGPGHLVPVVAVLNEIRGAHAIVCDSIPPEARNRPVSTH